MAFVQVVEAALHKTSSLKSVNLAHARDVELKRLKVGIDRFVKKYAAKLNPRESDRLLLLLRGRLLPEVRSVHKHRDHAICQASAADESRLVIIILHSGVR